MLGLLVCACAISLMLGAQVGLSPWDALHQGISKQFPITVGQTSMLMGFLVLGVSWVFLRQPIGIGTVMNMVFIGMFIDLTLPLVPHPEVLWTRWTQFLLGVLVMGLGTGMYVSSSLGAGPRDGMVLALSRVTPWGVKRIRTGIELVVLLCGWMLGGNVGWGTLAFALLIGPAMSLGMRLFGMNSKTST
ncbi:YczE/YyaS/YitT family protein [Deinococcus misasensis]|uniref:YczE/YyaS/YitT family protein n=1 Tax=Deinococcus misasensis TaxID=392413 RepID=UPI001FDF5481|nr:YitT family protein [Deinococcus misasensis]